jgi:hypothetical protein
MNWLRKLPGYQRTPYGFELRLLRMMPRVLVLGTLLPLLLSGLARLFFTPRAHRQNLPGASRSLTLP